MNELQKNESCGSLSALSWRVGMCKPICGWFVRYEVWPICGWFVDTHPNVGACSVVQPQLMAKSTNEMLVGHMECHWETRNTYQKSPQIDFFLKKKKKKPSIDLVVEKVRMTKFFTIMTVEYDWWKKCEFICNWWFITHSLIWL